MSESQRPAVSGADRVRVWHLEMKAAPSLPRPPSPVGDYRTQRVESPDLAQYRRLYVDVGGPWHWVMRRRFDEERLAAVLFHAGNELWHVLDGDRPVGFAELDFRRPADVELVYFGLVGETIGTGVGPWFLRSMMDEIWRRSETTRFWLHTCELDHPRALAFYQRLGLEIFNDRLEPGIDPDLPLLW